MNNTTGYLNPFFGKHQNKRCNGTALSSAAPLPPIKAMLLI
ncbi:hypothetical protein yinte0001_36920 [Yersinia intermedia ATCC 29909]|nr:hypothetical protein yinte0001_36920 [Yersinia intermedia ATCC 29909]